MVSALVLTHGFWQPICSGIHRSCASRSTRGSSSYSAGRWRTAPAPADSSFYYAATGVSAGLVWVMASLLLDLPFRGVSGPSGAVFALMVTFVVVFPDRSPTPALPIKGGWLVPAVVMLSLAFDEWVNAEETTLLRA